MTKAKLLLNLSVLALMSSGLTACGTSPQGTGSPEASVSRSSGNSVLYGDRREKLSSIEALYNQNQKDPMIAARYGKALREAGQYKAAKAILIPLTGDKTVATLANTELSAVYLSQADFEKAEYAARAAIKADEKNYRAWRNLGNALDAQEKYKEGETAFRKAMELWGNDDKIPVMNNLALNLAAQGYTDKALAMLYDAKKIDPNRVEIERNIRIIRTLNEPPEYQGQKEPLPPNKPPAE